MASVAESYRGQWMLYFVHEVDTLVDRITQDPQVRRSIKTMVTYEIQNRGGQSRNVSLFRAWEGEIMGNAMPMFMRNEHTLYFTGRWKGISLCVAPKNLHGTSRFPYVHDATLPQHRLNNGEDPRPLQDEYPVWYFLVGPLADDEVLQALFRLDEPPFLQPAEVHGFTTVQGSYCSGLARSSAKEVRNGWNYARGHACLLSSKLQEDRLRYFYTDLFKVVSEPYREQAAGTLN